MEQETKINVGDLRISEAVIVKMANYAIAEVAGVDSLAVRKSVFKKKAAPIQVHLMGDVVEITAYIIVKYGCRATTVAEQVQQTVKDQVQTMTGIAVSKVNVVVAGIAFEKK